MAKSVDMYFMGNFYADVDFLPKAGDLEALHC